MNNKKIVFLSAIVLSIISFSLVYLLDVSLLIKSSIAPISIFVVAFIATSSGADSKKPAQHRNNVSQVSSDIGDVDGEETTTLYVGNIPYRASEDDVVKHFEDITEVLSVRLMKDKRTGKKKGFGFIEVSPRAAKNLIDIKNDSVFMERNLIVRPAKDKVA